MPAPFLNNSEFKVGRLVAIVRLPPLHCEVQLKVPSCKLQYGDIVIGEDATFFMLSMNNHTFTIHQVILPTMVFGKQIPREITWIF